MSNSHTPVGIYTAVRWYYRGLDGKPSAQMVSVVVSDWTFYEGIPGDL